MIELSFNSVSSKPNFQKLHCLKNKIKKEPNFHGTLKFSLCMCALVNKFWHNQNLQISYIIQLNKIPKLLNNPCKKNGAGFGIWDSQKFQNLDLKN